MKRKTYQETCQATLQKRLQQPEIKSNKHQKDIIWKVRTLLIALAMETLAEGAGDKNRAGSSPSEMSTASLETRALLLWKEIVSDQKEK